MKYVDTSVLVSALVPERTSDVAVAWLARHQGGLLAASYWTQVEFHAALSRKLRTSKLSLIEYRSAVESFQKSVFAGLTLLPISSTHYGLASEIVQQHHYGIRAPDALHLAISAAAQITLSTFDIKLASAATQLGYSVELLS